MKIFGLLLKSIDGIEMKENEKYYFCVNFRVGGQLFEKRNDTFTIESEKTEINQMIQFVGYEEELAELQMKNEKEEILWKSVFKLVEGDKIEELAFHDQKSSYIQYSLEYTEFQWENEFERFIEIENNFLNFENATKLEIENYKLEIEDLKYELKAKEKEIKEKDEQAQEEMEKQLKLLISFESRLKEANMDDSSLDLKQQNQVLNDKIEAMSIVRIFKKKLKKS
jgi:hypothetical protein